jgi:hypothetical protein
LRSNRSGADFSPGGYASVFSLYLLTPVTNFFVFLTAPDQFALTADINLIFSSFIFLPFDIIFEMN